MTIKVFLCPVLESNNFSNLGKLSLGLTLRLYKASVYHLYVLTDGAKEGEFSEVLREQCQRESVEGMKKGKGVRFCLHVVHKS